MNPIIRADGSPKFAMISTVSEIVFGVGFALLLPRFFGLDGVLYSMPLSDLLTAFLSAAVIIMTYRALDRDSRPTQGNRMPQIS